MKIFSSMVVGLCVVLAVPPPSHAQDAAAQSMPLTYSIIATVIVRTPDPDKLAKYYQALGFVKQRDIPGQGVLFHLQNHQGTLEIIKMDPDASPSGPKTSRTQQGVVAIFETDQLDEVVARAKALGSPLIDTWTHPTAGVSIHYIADPENNILGFANRGHNPTINTP
jgi:predicted enzyme related to lactoylglutathione lyase